VCHGDIIAFVDDDETVHQNWLGWLSDSFAKSEVGLTTGLVLPGGLASRAQQLFEQRFSFVRGYAPASFGREYYRRHRLFGVPVWKIGGSGNLAIRRSVFEQLGGFDERLGAGAAGCSEDTELIYAALVNEWDCCYEPRAVTWHYHRQSMDELHEQVFSYMRGHVVALLIQYAKYRDLGNLVRLCLILPRTYVGYSLRALRGDPGFGLSLLRREVAGCCSGLWFYWQNWRQPNATITPSNTIRTTEGQR
jgi:GT2 family glycosyltransferase